MFFGIFKTKRLEFIMLYCRYVQAILARTLRRRWNSLYRGNYLQVGELFYVIQISGEIITTSLRPHCNHVNKRNHPNMALFQVSELL